MNTGFVNDWMRRSSSSTFNPGGEREKLFLEYCRLVENGEIIPEETDSYVVVDNFYVNGDFIEKDGVDNNEWQQAKNNAIVANDNIALVSCPGLL